MLRESSGKREGVIVTGSVSKASNYHLIVRALNCVCDAKERGEDVGDIYLVACENMVSAHEVFADENLCGVISPETRGDTKCLHALVDRMCVGLEEFGGGQDSIAHPTVLVRAEQYGSLKLELRPVAGDRQMTANHLSTTDLIIFDCDGVLIDSEIFVCRIAADELTRLGYSITVDQVMQRFAGRPDVECGRRSSVIGADRFGQSTQHV